VPCAGLAPLVALAARAGFAGHVPCEGVGDQGPNPWLKVPALVVGMVAGADSIVRCSAGLDSDTRAPSRLRQDAHVAFDHAITVWGPRGNSGDGL
jgi:hypothetical protein